MERGIRDGRSVEEEVVTWLWAIGMDRWQFAGKEFTCVYKWFELFLALTREMNLRAEIQEDLMMGKTLVGVLVFDTIDAEVWMSKRFTVPEIPTLRTFGIFVKCTPKCR